MATDDEFQETVTPVIVYFVILNIVGLFGNSFILYIYSFRYKKSHFRLLVLSLSCVDMISCCTTVPMEMVSTWFWFSAPSRGLCKLKNFCVQFSATCAMYMFFVTAVYKYLRICRPYGKHGTKKNVAQLFFMGISVSLLLATPAAIMWDINVESMVMNNVTETVRICEIFKDYRGTPYPLVYRIVLSVYNILLIATIVLYFFVAKTIIVHIRGRRWKTMPAKRKVEKQTSLSTTDDTDTTETDTSQVEDISNNSSAANRQSTGYRQGRSTLSLSEIRKAVILVILAGTFSATFTMGLSLGYVFATHSYKDFASINEMVALFSCYKFYYINYALNSIVCLILDRSYRSEVFKLFGLSRFACTAACMYARN